jgi:two-component system, chemotaxis family, response regulator WspF
MRIALVNDVTMAVEAMRLVVTGTGQHQVAWTAHDGAEAVKLCERDRPDLVLMDLIMPRMDGVEATRHIMARSPCAIVVVTANVTQNSSRVFQAMSAGALDAVNTPVLENPGACEGGETLLAKIETIRRLIVPPSPKIQPGWSNRSCLARPSHHDCLIAIGASAGGPAALARLLTCMPRDFPAPVVVVQHVDAQFADGLAKWLDAQAPLHVRLAQDNDHPEAGTVLLAGRNSHLVFTSPTRLAYTDTPADCAYRPSIDVFFTSADRFWPGSVVGVVLTGMGNDGAQGLRILHGNGHHTIAQDRASSAVYGMPKAAVDLQAASEVLSLDRIGPRLRNIVAQKNSSHG